MHTLSLNEMSYVLGGTWNDVATVACSLVGVGSAVYYVGAVSNWWNPIGWVSTALAVADIACIGYSISQL